MICVTLSQSSARKTDFDDFVFKTTGVQMQNLIVLFWLYFLSEITAPSEAFQEEKINKKTENSVLKHQGNNVCPHSVSAFMGKYIYRHQQLE